MPSSAANAALRDILHHITLAEQFIAGLDQSAFETDMRTVYAVTRCLEIISGASRRLSASGDRNVSVILFRLRRPGAQQVLQRLGHCLQGAGPEIERGAVAIVEDARVRLRRLPIEE